MKLKNGTLANPSLRQIVKHRALYVMLLPGMLCLIVFKYLPMLGLFVAFEDYQPFKGVWKSPWAGFEHFNRFFHEPTFWLLTKNTMLLSVYNIIFFFPIPIVFAILLNEARLLLFKRLIQTFVYVPHFVSWVVVYGLTYLFFTNDGFVNQLLVHLGFGTIDPLTNPAMFKTMIILQQIWKEAGWNTIIIFAAIAGLDPELYKAAEVDGAGRFRKMWSITLPGIRSTVIILLLLRIGSFFDTGFEQILMAINAINRNAGEVFDTFVYQYGITGGQLSYATAVGLFKSVVTFVLVIGVNRIVRKFGEEGLF